MKCLNQSACPFGALKLRQFKHQCFAPVLLMLSFLLSAGCSFAAAPANDLCAGAVSIPGNGPFPHSTQVVDISGATTNGDPVLPGDFYPTRVIRSVWFTFTPAASGNYTIASCGGAGGAATTADTVMAIYTSASGCNGPFQINGELDDETCSPQAALTRSLLADTKYYVVVWKFFEGGADNGLNSVQLLVTATIPPANDTCANAILLSLNIPAHGSTAGGTDDYRIVIGSPSFTGIDQTPSIAAGRDVVYSFTAPKAGKFSFKTFDYDTLEDLVIYVTADCPAASPGNPKSLAPIASANRSLVNAEQIICVPMTAGQTVFLFVDDAGSGNAGSPFTVEVTGCIRERESNDSPADASPISCGVEGSIGSTIDRDFYTLGNFPPGWRAFAVVDGDAARAADFDLRITTFSDTIEYDADDNDMPFRPSSPNIAGALLPGGPVFVFVNYKAPRAAEPYRLYAVVQPPLADATVETEPNNSTGEANFSEQNYFRGTLDGGSPSPDVDHFAFNLTEGDLLFLSLDGDPHRTNAPINARLELIDANGEILISVNDGNSSSLDSTNISLGNLTATSPTAPGETILFRTPAEGTFYARVSISPTATGSSASGEYLLSISRNCRAGSEGFNHSPVLNNVAISEPVVVGAPARLTGSIWDIDLGDAHSLRINWGDGSSNSVNYSSAGRIDFDIPHTYASLATNVPIEVILTDSEGLTATVNLNIRVRPPLQPARFTAVRILSNGNVRMELEGTPQAGYLIEYRSPGNDWLPLGSRSAAANGIFSIEDTTPSDTSRFYRATAE